MNVLVTQTNQEVGVTAVIEDSDTGELFDPASVNFWVLEPDDTFVAIPGDKEEVGVYTLKYTLTKRGTYGIEITTTFPVMSAGVNVTAGWRNAFT